MKFNYEQMKKFAEQDALVKLMAKDLQSRGHSEEEALEVVFNSEILGDSVMEDAYRII